MGLTKISVKVDDETLELLRAYSEANDGGNLSKTARDLIQAGLYLKLDRIHARYVRQAVSDELDVFLSALRRGIADIADDVMIGLDERLSDQMALTAKASLATLAAISELAASQPDEDRDEDRIRTKAVDSAADMLDYLV